MKNVKKNSEHSKNRLENDIIHKKIHSLELQNNQFPVLSYLKFFIIPQQNTKQPINSKKKKTTMSEPKTFSEYLNNLKQNQNIYEETNLKELCLKFFETKKQQLEEEKECCEICCEEITSQNRFVIQPCGCSTCCLKCVKDHVSEYINNGRVDIPCPVCSKLISTDLLLSTLIDSKELLDKYSRNSLNNYISTGLGNACSCPSCHSNIYCFTDYLKVECPQCNKFLCRKCLRHYHEGVTCEEYDNWKRNQNVEAENDAKLIEWLKANGAICPKCGLGCQRISGSNWIYCNPNVGGCGAGFCYKCQKEVDHYSPHILKADCSLSPNENK